MLRNADVAMYAAKARGKACYQVFETRMHEQLLDRLDSETRLRDAVHRGELRVDLQPVVEVATRRTPGVEALVRWADPERGLQLGHTLGLKVVAEGVETEEQLGLLAAMGCRYAQGYHLGVPEAAADLMTRSAAVATV